jgi:hypothetical protein
MARFIQAIATYRPRVKRGPTVQIEEVAAFMCRGRSLSPSQVQMVLAELRDAVIHFNQLGRAVKLPGLGTFGTTVDRNGRIGVSYFPDPALRRALNDADVRDLALHNPRHVGLDDAGYKALWDADHPDDPVDLGND